MDEKRTKILSRLEDSLTRWYDIEAQSGHQEPLVMAAQYHSRSEKYVLSKKAKLWGAENHDYLFVFSKELFTTQDVESCINDALAQGLELVNPHPEHMYSHITAILVGEDFEPEGLHTLKKWRFTKNYKFSIHGWAALMAVAINLSDDTVTTNPQARQKLKFYKQIVKELTSQ